MRVNVAGRRLWATATVMSLVIALGSMPAEATTARRAKDITEQATAVTAAAHYLQGQGFTDPMLSAESIDNRVLTVTVDNKAWTNKTQKVEFLDRMNGGVLSANGGIAIDIHVSMSGAKVGSSTFSAGQQSLRLLE